jgi:hypothetical protein
VRVSVPLLEFNQPCQITHREGFEGYTITESWYRDMQGQMRCDCVIKNPDRTFHRRYAKLEEARAYLAAHLDMQRIRAEA